MANNQYKVSLFVICCVILVLWILSPSRKRMEALYTQEEFNQDISKLYFDLGQLSQKRGDYQKAIAPYATALEHNPNDLEIYDHLGYCYQMQNKPELAEQVYKKALRIDPEFKAQTYVKAQREREKQSTFYRFKKFLRNSVR